KAPYNFATM
nr:Chain C, Pre-glycoprotein polyprotein GP [synthetic construct]5TIL_C Chain C, Pre-glycoprotein polyprotein GP complex [Mammarenavirus choriomeningitidis]5TIL_F Chain F, Pre-glycoprotein polyprotein GP complex [Mammarenavirus choriomeningitidis]